MERCDLMRGATRADLEEIMAVERESFEEGVMEPLEVFAERLEVFPEGFLVLLDEGGAVIGYICAELRARLPAPHQDSFELGRSISRSHHAGGVVLYISSMGLKRSARGAGRGAQLLSGLVRAARRSCPQVQHLSLIVSEEWPHAQRIYERGGFYEVGRIGGFFKPLDRPPADAIVMRADL